MEETNSGTRVAEETASRYKGKMCLLWGLTSDLKSQIQGRDLCSGSQGGTGVPEPGVLQGLPGAEVQGPPAAGVLHKLNTIAKENERYNLCIYVHITQKEIHKKRV